jgi:hypothetical protein
MSSGQPLNATVDWTVEKTIDRGAYAKVTVKYGLIQLLSTTADVCEQIEAHTNLKCPVQPGSYTTHLAADLPSAIPPVRSPIDHALIPPKAYLVLCCLEPNIDCIVGNLQHFHRRLY